MLMLINNKIPCSEIILYIVLLLDNIVCPVNLCCNPEAFSTEVKPTVYLIQCSNHIIITIILYGLHAGKTAETMYSYRNTAQDSHKLLIQGDITPILTKISPTKR